MHSTSTLRQGVRATGNHGARKRGVFSRAARDERGTVAIIFALSLVVLAPMILGLFDVYTASEQRDKLQDALDAAALYAARSDFQEDAEIQTLGEKALAANLTLLRGATLLSSSFTLSEDKTKVIATATIQPLALAPALWAHPNVETTTEVTRSSKNLEVALVLDITGSMLTGSKLADLKTAARDLIDIVVKPTQSPFYSKVALVPWSSGVNVGALADQARGSITPGRPLTAYSTWYTGTQKNVTGATRANPVVVTAAAHGFSNGDTVMLTRVTGMTQINGRAFVVANKTNDTFQLQGVNGGSYGNFTANGNNDKVSKCVRTDCSVVFTANSHGFTDGSAVYVASTGGISAFRDKAYTVSGATANTFNIFEPSGPTSAFSAGGVAYCTTPGCEYHRFTAVGGGTKIYKSSTCVSERVGNHEYDDAAPSTALVGRNYPSVAGVAGTTVVYAGPCSASAEIIPLTSEKETVKTAITNLVASGTTAGQTGTAWGWYMVSPNFASLFDTDSQPGAYGQSNLLKVVVVMTDGALNTAYCNGVASADSTPQYPTFATDHINCNATNGDTFTQSSTLCTNMKAAGVTVYAVGFDIAGDATATTFVNGCATSNKHVYLPTSGTALKDAFKAIGRDIAQLRLSK